MSKRRLVCPVGFRLHIVVRYASTDAQLRSLRAAVANVNVEEMQLTLHRLVFTEKRILPHRDLQDVTTLLRNVVRYASQPTELQCELAVYLASRGHPTILETVLSAAIFRGDMHLPIKLWNELRDHLRTKVISHTASAPSLETVVKKLGTVLGTALVAFATRIENNSMVIHACLGVASGISPVRFAIGDLQLPDGTAARLDQIYRRVHLARILERPASAILHFSRLFDHGDISITLSTYEEILHGLTSNDAWIAPAPGFDRERWPVVITEPLWSFIIAGFLKAGHADTAHSVWNDMTSLKVNRTAVTWNGLLDGYGQLGGYHDLMKVWDQMGISATPKDVFSYTSVISTLFKLKRREEALKIFQGMRKEMKDGTLTPATANSLANSSTALIVPFNAVIHGLLISANPEEAQIVLSEMQTHGPAPDITTFNTFIRHYSRKGDMRTIATFLRHLPRTGVQPDVVTFTSVLHACLRSGLPASDAIRRVDTAMHAADVTPNTVTYTALIDQTMRTGGISSVNAGFEWLEVMQRRGIQPNEITFTGLLAALHRDHTLPRAFVEEKCKEITHKMRMMGTKPNRVTYNVLIKASISRRDEVGMSQAVAHYRQMISEGIMPNDDTWYLLFTGVLAQEDLDLGRGLIKEMQDSEFIASGALAVLISRIHGTPPSNSW